MGGGARALVRQLKTADFFAKIAKTTQTSALAKNSLT